MKPLVILLAFVIFIPSEDRQETEQRQEHIETPNPLEKRIFPEKPQYDLTVIQNHIEMLGDDSYSARERSTLKLMRMGRPAFDMCKKLMQESDNPEVKARVTRIVRAFYHVRPTKGFMPDTRDMDEKLEKEVEIFLGVDDPIEHYEKIARVHLGPYRHGYWDDYGDWRINVYQVTLHFMIVDLIDNGCSRGKIRKLLDRMQKEAWKRDRGIGYYPSY